MREKIKESTIRVKKSTKEKLMDLDFARKNKSYDEIINELLNKYNHKKNG